MSKTFSKYYVFIFVYLSVYEEYFRPLLTGASLVALMVKEPACSEGDPSLIPGSGRSSGEGNSYPLQYSCLKSLVGYSP